MARDDELDRALIDASYQLQESNYHQSKYKRKISIHLKQGLFDNEFKGCI